MISTRQRSIPLLLLAAVAVSACSRKKPAAAPAPAAAPTVSDDAERARRDSLARAEAARRDSIDRAERERAERERALAAARATLVAPVHFSFDQSDLGAEALATLEAKVPILAASPAVHIRISGHADERGSDEYNLALGQRRASATKRFLTDRGIDAARVEIVSLGEEQPACTGSDESCWAQNRRAEFEMTAGSISIP